ncbi:MAG: hypothetical protein QNI89_14360, partial [Desulfobacterales bacterium]|nr:hypothetical protein [Desulfobacterales bacterium]
MIYRRCSCGKDRAVNKASCSCGSKSTRAFKAAVVLPGTGGRRRTRTCPTLSEAQAAELALKAEIPTVEPETVAEAVQNAVSVPTFDELWEQYHAYSKLRKRSWKADLCRYHHHLKDPLGSKRVDTIKAADIQTIVDGCMLRKGLAPATAVQVFALIRVILSHADRFELTPNGMPNPCRRVQ